MKKIGESPDDAERWRVGMLGQLALRRGDGRLDVLRRRVVLRSSETAG
jgi:hypothetical protein